MHRYFHRTVEKIRISLKAIESGPGNQERGADVTPPMDYAPTEHTENTEGNYKTAYMANPAA